jgi:uncharacterized damage-inducible protein DinB
MREWHLDPVQGFAPGVGRFVAMFVDARRRLLRDLEGMRRESLDAIPLWGRNSIGTLLYHVAAIELDWAYADLLEGSQGFPDGTEDWFPVDVRERDGRLTPVVEPLQRHLDRLEWTRSRFLEVLGGLTDPDLERTFSNGDDENGGSWILHHLLQHEAEHRGQIAEIRTALET